MKPGAAQSPAIGYWRRPLAGFLLLPAVYAILSAQRTSDLMLSGKVVIAGGKSLEEPARIDLSCKGSVQVLGYTDPQGLFNFRVPEQLPASDQTARMGPGISTQAKRSAWRHYNLAGCELSAELPGYVATPVVLSRRSVFGGTSVGQIVLRPDTTPSEGGGGVVSAKALAVPRKAQKAYSRALAAMDRPKPDLKTVLRHLKEALTIHPQFAEAWILVGQAHALAGNLESAREAFVQALRSDARSVPAILSLCLADLKLNRIHEAATLADQALELSPGLIEAHFYAGLAQVSLGDLAAAEKSLLTVRASAECNRFPRSYYLLGEIYDQQGNWEKAAAEYRKYLEIEPVSQAAEKARQRLAELAKQTPL